MADKDEIVSNNVYYENWIWISFTDYRTLFITFNFSSTDADTIGIGFEEQSFYKRRTWLSFDLVKL